jgi:hypothetical protein
MFAMEVCNKTARAGGKVCWGGDVLWTCNFCNIQYKSTYYQVKSHLLGLDCGLGACKAVNATKRKEMETKDNIGLGKVEAATRKHKNEDPLPLLRKPSSRFVSGTAIHPARKRPAPSGGTMDKIFQQDK